MTRNVALFIECRAVRGAHATVVRGARLRRARLRLVIHVDDAEAFGVAKAPFIVVEQAPDEVSAELGTLGDGVARGLEMLTEIPDAHRIVHGSIDRVRRVVQRRSILGDVERDASVALSHPEERALERPWMYLPTSLGVRMFRLTDVRETDRPCFRVVPHDAARVIVDPEKVD